MNRAHLSCQSPVLLCNNILEQYITMTCTAFQWCTLSLFLTQFFYKIYFNFSKFGVLQKTCIVTNCISIYLLCTKKTIMRFNIECKIKKQLSYFCCVRACQRPLSNLPCMPHVCMRSYLRPNGATLYSKSFLQWLLIKTNFSGVVFFFFFCNFFLP